MEQSYGLIELSLVFGAVLALALYELVSVRRSISRDRAARQAAEPPEDPQGAPKP